MVAGEIFGLPIPDAGPLFATALAVHVGCGLTAVGGGALAATAKKRPGRHPRAGHVYLWALGGVFTTATIMAMIRWHEDRHLFAIAVVAFGLGLYGYQARRRHRPGWPTRHGIGMGGSYITLLTGFYVDNGPFLPLWNRLPHITYWLLPTIIGVPLIWLALRRYAATASVKRGGQVPALSMAGLASCTWVQAYRGDMTDQSPVDLGWVPEACTLPTAQQPLRLAEFDALLSASVGGSERLGARHLRITLTGGPDLADTVRDLAERETQCCSFFAFGVEASQPGLVRLDIEVPAGHVDVLDALEARAAVVRSQP
jgi:hypothetical protein